MNVGIRSHRGSLNLREGRVRNGAHDTFSCSVQQLWAKRPPQSLHWFLQLSDQPSSERKNTETAADLVKVTRNGSGYPACEQLHIIRFQLEVSGVREEHNLQGAVWAWVHWDSAELRSNSVDDSWLSGSVIYTAAWFWGREHEYVQYTVAHTVRSVSRTVAHCTREWGWSSTGDRGHPTHWLLC